MIRALMVAAVILVISSCAPTPTKIEVGYESIPTEVATEYLQTESVKFSFFTKCTYTSTGINGIPYSALELKAFRSVMVDQAIDIWKKGTAVLYSFSDTPNYICNSFHSDTGLNKGHSKPEIVDAFNRTATALMSLGVSQADIR